MTKLLFKVLGTVLFLLLLAACQTEQAAKPTYVKIDALHLRTDYAEEGTAHHDINTIWLNLNGQSVGAFELPAIIPLILEDGANTLRVEAGINTNGIRSFRAINSSFTPVILELNGSSEGPIDTIIPEPNELVVEYRSFYEVVVVENFDEPGLNFERTNFSDTSFIKDGDSVFNYIPFGATDPEPNDNSGLIVLDDLNSDLELRSVVSYNIPAGVQNIYLEVTYRTNMDVGFGLIANYPTGNQGDVTAVVFPKEEWSKIYINLISEFQAFPGANGYQLLIRARKPEDIGEGRIYLDNLKMVYQRWKILPGKV